MDQWKLERNTCSWRQAWENVCTWLVLVSLVIGWKSDASFFSQSEETCNPMDQWKIETNTCSWCQARENVCILVTIGFVFPSYWLNELVKWKKGREFLKPIKRRSNVITNQIRITFDAQVKTALNGLVISTVTLGRGSRKSSRLVLYLRKNE